MQPVVILLDIQRCSKDANSPCRPSSNTAVRHSLSTPGQGDLEQKRYVPGSKALCLRSPLSRLVQRSQELKLGFKIEDKRSRPLCPDSGSACFTGIIGFADNNRELS